MRLVYKFYIRHTDELDRLFRISNNLYNQALYIFRQRLDKVVGDSYISRIVNSGHSLCPVRYSNPFVGIV